MTSLLIFAAAMLLHELGHAVMALVLGVKVHRIGLCWAGMYTEFDLPETRAEFYVITMAGPITSFAFLLLGCFEGWYSFPLANLCILVACFLPQGDFWRLFQYSNLLKAARVRMYLAEVCRG